MAGLKFPRSTLHPPPHEHQRMTRGQTGTLFLKSCGSFIRYLPPALTDAFPDSILWCPVDFVRHGRHAMGMEAVLPTSLATGRFRPGSRPVRLTEGSRLPLPSTLHRFQRRGKFGQGFFDRGDPRCQFTTPRASRCRIIHGKRTLPQQPQRGKINSCHTR